MPSRRPTRPHWGRVVLVLASATITTVAVLGGAGVLPAEREGAVAPERDTARLAAQATPTPVVPTVPTAPTASVPTTPTPSDATPEPDPAVVPAGSGTGRRVVF